WDDHDAFFPIFRGGDRVMFETHRERFFVSDAASDVARLMVCDRPNDQAHRPRPPGMGKTKSVVPRSGAAMGWADFDVGSPGGQPPNASATESTRVSWFFREFTNLPMKKRPAIQSKIGTTTDNVEIARRGELSTKCFR